MNLFVYDLTVLYLEGIEMDAFVEGEDSIADVGVDGQTEVFLRGTREGGGMAVPVGENLQALAAGIAQGCKLVLGCKGEVLR